MIRILPIVVSLILGSALCADDFRPFANFLLSSHVKVTGGQVTPIPIKPIVFHVATDGLHLRISADGNEEASTTFEIYRSDGIGRQRKGETAFDIIPGIQAMSRAGGVLRHLRLTREYLTITSFPGVSDHTTITHALAIAPTTPGAAKTGEKAASTKP
ncbi:MAG: hypothetical protein WCJ66_01060 [Verrucomicrobiota bacterium]